ncbi:hypothetical protein BH09PLA1_BH09PLA1_14600 [soil metagenome]
MRASVINLCIVPCAFIYVSTSAFAATPVKLIDTSTPGPNGEMFQGFQAPRSTDHFAARWSNGGSGVLLLNPSGSYSVIASNTTPIPAGTGAFTGFDSPDFRIGRATGDNQEGLYLLNNSSHVAVVADRSTPIPGGSGTFERFGHYPLGDQNGTFYGEGAGLQRGIYGYTNLNTGPIFVRADTQMMFPGTTEHFTEFSERLSGSMFIGRSATHRGVFWSGGPGEPTPIIDTSFDVLAGSAGEKFTDFDEVSSVATPAIIGHGESHYGVYFMSGLPFWAGSRRVADNTTTIPGGTGVFTGFSDLNSVSGLDFGLPTVVFTGYGIGGQKGIYGAELYQSGGQNFGKILAVGDSVDGKIVSDLAMTNQGGTYQIYFLASFSDGSSGIYRMQTPEPTMLALPLLVLTLMRRRDPSPTPQNDRPPHGPARPFSVRAVGFHLRIFASLGTSHRRW